MKTTDENGVGVLSGTTADNKYRILIKSADLTNSLFENRDNGIYFIPEGEFDEQYRLRALEYAKRAEVINKAREYDWFNALMKEVQAKNLELPDYARELSKACADKLSEEIVAECEARAEQDCKDDYFAVSSLSFYDKFGNPLSISTVEDLNEYSEKLEGD